MPKVDDRHATKPYKSLLVSAADPSKQNAPVGGSYNALARCDINTEKYVYWSAGDDTALHEAAFVPQTPNALGRNGFVLIVANRCDNILSSILILDTAASAVILTFLDSVALFTSIGEYEQAAAALELHFINVFGIEEENRNYGSCGVPKADRLDTRVQWGGNELPSQPSAET
ncbi:hypothetical protein DL98DRAFT_589704 [Cadophora sp. DSE1049]|nr:hypothetical protein DL98DRAFT_589704 [Cadophora sp. DSE1049]